MKLFAKYIYVFLFAFSSLVALAQPGSKKDKIEALRVNFISQKVNFTSQEAQLFWPLYDEYNDKLDFARKSFRQQFVKASDVTTLTDKEAEAFLNAELSLKQREFELYKEYFERFKKVLPVKKVALLRRAEEEFKKELIKNIKGNSSE
ncbi:MAG: hypothetical protein K0S53_3368 [Bacteroidetes bacterium]|jgi:hypothetical protein|nr:hypothetical protein [Bacteroidota bacterium]MDF2453279.1 hypothetical protein [Bacteroidota bacterium]